MTGGEIIDIVWHSIEAIGVLVAVLVARHAKKKDDVTAIVLAVLADEAFTARWEEMREDAKESGRVAANDALQVFINRPPFIPREAQNAINAEIMRRLDNVETRMQDVEKELRAVPRETAREVMLLLREQKNA